MGALAPPIEIWASPPGGDPVRAEYANWVRDNWLDLGIDASVHNVAWDGLFEGLQNNAEGGVNLRWSSSPTRLDPDFGCYFLFHSSGADEWYNISEIRDDEYDALAEEQRLFYDNQERLAPVHACQAYVATNQLATPLTDPRILQAYRTDRFKNPVLAVGDGLRSFHNFHKIEPVSSDVTAFRVGTNDTLQHLNPLAPTDNYGVIIMQHIYDRLFQVSENGEPQPWSATGLEQVDDSTFDVSIRDDLLFHDGEPVTAEDVQFSFEYQAEHSSMFQGNLGPLDSVERTGEYDLRFNLTQPFAPFTMRALAAVWILPKHIWDGVSTPAEFSNPKIGSGPWVFEEWRPEERLLLSRFDDYFEPAKAESAVIIPSPIQALVDRIANRELDALITDQLPASSAERLRNASNVEVVEVPSHDLYMFHPPTVHEPPWDDVEFRRALAYTFPRQRIVDVLLRGIGEVTYSPIPPSNGFWHNPDAEAFEFDMDTARQTLADAGYTWDDNDRLHLPA